MLFVESKTLKHSLNVSRRIQLLDKLQEENLVPVIRAARLKCFECVLPGHELAREMEAQVAGSSEKENQQTYIGGDLFCQDDHVFFLVFDDEGRAPLIRAGIVYETRTAEPLPKLDAFCRTVREIISAWGAGSFPETDNGSFLAQWEHGAVSIPLGFKSFVAKQDTDSLYTSLRKKTMSDRIRASSILEDTSARVFLRRAKEAHVEGYAAKLLAGDSLGPHQSSIERLAEVGLVEREVQVSCRKTGHALFRLPNPNALAVVTVSDATCSECGSPVADEKVEEVIAPTRLAASLLEDGSWLVSRLHQVLRELGVPESEIAVGPSEGEGYGQMMANICGESFLIVARDGDLTPAFARWAIDLEIETEASHLAVVATARVHNHAAALLHNHARRRIRSGRDFELILGDDVTTARDELKYAFERVSHRILAEQLYHLDSGLGLSVKRLVLAKFKLGRTRDETNQPAFGAELVSGFIPRRPLTLAAHAAAHNADYPGSRELVDEEGPQPSDSQYPIGVESPLNAEVMATKTEPE